MSLEWKDIAASVAKAAPLLGTLLGGPAGGAIGGLIASALGTEPTPSAVSQALQTNPDAAVKLAQIEADQRVKLQELATDQAKAEIAAAAQAAGDVNKTMQAEAASEHWPTYGWRPAIGFAVALAVVLSVLTVFAAYGAAIIYNRAEGLAQLPGILAAVAGIIAVVSPILGIASWYRGKMQADPNISTVNRG
jgi:roadblock/LC7 domain-containing protein